MSPMRVSCNCTADKLSFQHNMLAWSFPIWVLVIGRLTAEATTLRQGHSRLQASNAHHPDDHVTVEEVQEARDRWVDAVHRLNLDDVLNCYAKEAGVTHEMPTGRHKQGGWLLGTVDKMSDGHRRTTEGIRDYFTTFLKKDAIHPEFPGPVTPSDLLQLGHGRVAYGGYYTFVFENRSPKNPSVVKKQKAAAKFVYIYQRSGEDHTGPLEIVLHNSGLTPEGVSEWEEQEDQPIKDRVLRGKEEQ